MKNEVPSNLIPDELQYQGGEVPEDMLPDEFKSRRLPLKPSGMDIAIGSPELAVSHIQRIPASKTHDNYPTIGAGTFDPFSTSMAISDIRKSKREESLSRSEAIKKDPSGLWDVKPGEKGTPALNVRIPLIGEVTEQSLIPFVGTAKKVFGFEPFREDPFKEVMEPTAEALQIWLGGKAIAGVINIIGRSTWFRMLTNKERGVVIQTVEDMKKAGLSDAKIARTVRSEFEKMNVERMKYEGYKEPPISAGEVKPKPIVSKSKEVPIEMVPEGLAKPEPKVEALSPPQPLPTVEVLPKAPLVKPQRVDEVPLEMLPEGLIKPVKLPKVKPTPPKVKKQLEKMVEANPEEDIELTGTIRELLGIMKAGQPGGVVGEGGERYGSSQAVEKIIGMEGVSRKEALSAIEKGFAGKPLSWTDKKGKFHDKQQRIWDSINENAKAIIKDRRAQDELDRVRAEIKDPRELTKHLDDEIMGLREELNEVYSDDEINRAIEEVTKNITAEGSPPDIAAIEKEIRSILTPRKSTELASNVSQEIQKAQKDIGITESKLPLEERVRLLERAGYPQEAAKLRGVPSPTRKGETLLPGMKVGLEMKGAKETTPTLEGTPLMEASRKAEIDKIQPSIFGDNASIGTYDVGGGGSAAQRPQEPPDRMVNIVEMPEMVELYNQLSQGKYPAVKQKLRAFHGLASGLYRPKTGKVDLRADIFQDPAQARATLAHEIFHFIDDLPDYMLNQRGNIFGRIATLKKYMKHYLEGYEGAPGPLTDIDKQRLMKEAKEALSVEKLGAEQQAMAFRDIKLTPDDIKAIWNDVEARSKNKTIYDFIVSLSEVEKNQIVREAMKGIVSEVNQRRFRISIPIEGRPFKDWDQRLRDIFNKLIKEELDKRKLFTYDTMISELKNLSMTWKPFTPIPGDKFTKYRFSSKELYADAGSVLLNDPNLLATKAPSFYKAFFNYIHRKPEVKQVYDDIQARIGRGEEAILGHRREGIKAMFNKGEAILSELRKTDKLNILQSIRTAFVSRREGLLKLKREVEKKGGTIDPDKNPDYWTEELPYISSPIFQNIRDINNLILKPASNNGITQSDIGEYLLYRREATERAKMANPKGFTEADALKQMDFLKKEIGDEKFNYLTDLVKKSWELRKKNVFPILEKSETFSSDTMNLIENNEVYATISVMDHLEAKHGSNITSKIYRQIGTLREVVNPLTATVMKDMSLVRMAERKMIAEATVDFLTENGFTALPASKRWTGKYYDIAEPTDPKLGLIIYTHNGKPTGYYVDKSIANIFNRDPYDFQPILRILSIIQSPLKQIFVSKNPGWWIFNIQRDIKALAKQIPGMNLLRSVKYSSRAFPDAYKDVFKDVSTEDVDAMYKIKALGVGRYWSDSELSGETQLDNIVKSFGETPTKYDFNVLKPYKMVWEYLKAGSMLLDKFGAIGERIPKIAAYKFLKENSSLSDKEISHLVRKRAGSPDFWEKGGLDFLYNNVFWFSNAGKEGIRAAIEAAKENPASYTWKTIKYDVLPKLLMFAGGVGLLGGTIKKLMDNIPGRDKANYLTIPIGETSEGKTVYLIQPHDFQGQVIAGLLWKSMRTGKFDSIGDIVDYVAGGLPYTGLNPLLGLASDWKQYFTGKNPYDSFRGKYVLPETVFQAGGKEAINGMAKYSSNQLGGGIVYRFKGNSQKEITGELEKILGLPIAGNFFSRFLRVSDSGRTDEYRYISEQVRIERAKELVKIDSSINKWAEENLKTIKVHPKTLYNQMLKDKTIQRHTYNEFIDRLSNTVLYKLGSPESSAILGAKSSEEKIAIIKKIIEKQKGK